MARQNRTVAKPYFDSPLPHRLAHRGATLDGLLDENTMEAFRAALEQGATHIETDVQATKDGVVVAFHDEDLTRVTGGLRSEKIESLAWNELRQIPLSNGGLIPSFADVLREFPGVRFNIDVKAKAAATPLAKAIIGAEAVDRVLITSFSDLRRRSTLRALRSLADSKSSTGAVKLADAATSAGAAKTALALLAFALGKVFGSRGAQSLLRLALAGVDALQVPTNFGPIRVDRPEFIRAVRNCGRHIHFWVVNDPNQCRLLLSAGASGIVSDDLAKAFA